MPSRVDIKDLEVNIVEVWSLLGWDIEGEC